MHHLSTVELRLGFKEWLLHSLHITNYPTEVTLATLPFQQSIVKSEKTLKIAVTTQWLLFCHNRHVDIDPYISFTVH